MTYEQDVSPSRQYEITMSNHDSTDTIVTLVDLPETLVNDRFTAQVWYNKYVPEHYHIVEARPFVKGEEVEETEHVGFGDELDYVGPDEEEDDGESFISFAPVNEEDSEDEEA